MSSIIHTALAAPGAGKTQTMIEKLPNYIKQGERVIIALPTRRLNGEILSRMKDLNLNPKVINSDEIHNKSVSKSIEGTLRNGNENLILVTHEGLKLTNPELLQGWILIIDETPAPLKLHHDTLGVLEAQQVFRMTDINDNFLTIKPGMITEMKQRVTTYKASKKDQSKASTLSGLEHKLFEALLSEQIIYIEEGLKKGKVVFHFHTIIESNIYSHIKHAKETHILSATMEGGLFDLFSKKLGFQYKPSPFTPATFEYNCEITIFPMMDGMWSKTQALKNESGDHYWFHLAMRDCQMIDRVLANAINNTPEEDFLVISNSWADFGPHYDIPNKKSGIDYSTIDCRGLNTYKGKTAASLLFSGRPSPNDQKSFQILSEKHGISRSDLINAWIVTNKLDASLQAATRTAVRDRENKKPVFLYVQDLQVAEYLKKTHMKNAIINTSLALTPPKQRDNRCAVTADEKNKVANFIKISFEKGMRRLDINRALIELWEVSETTARRWTRNILQGVNPKSVEGLEEFFV
ncbi:hypothetical protein [Pseudomonas lini]|uniref:hypothetical protein n=1 Tax=Pseudomonas lini TaxID=163011 RepID=UPI00345E9CEB